MSALAAGWNALVDDLRQRDLLSNKELAHVSFEHLLLDDRQEVEVRSWGLTTVLPARYKVHSYVCLLVVMLTLTGPRQSNRGNVR